MMDIGSIIQKVSNIEPWVIAQRREFHRHPELGMNEYWTSQRITGLLDEMEIPFHKTVSTGIVGIILGEKPGKTIALRADMDGLPIEEATGLEYSSISKGKMHACGHDAHMAILLGTAKILNEIREGITGNIKLLFQPAEETIGGAQRMIEEGCLENPQVDEVLGLHVTPDAEIEQIMLRRGIVTATSDSFQITIHGKSAHAAYPEAGVDAIIIAAQVINALQTIISRNISPLKAGVITLGKIEGGTQENIIADNVILNGTMRTLNPQIRKHIQDRILKLVTEICIGMEGKGTVELNAGYPSIMNDDNLVQVVETNAVHLLGPKNVIPKEKPSLGVDDFAFFSQHAPSVFYYLGCSNRSLGISAPEHSPQFQIDEACLGTGILLQVIQHFIVTRESIMFPININESLILLGPSLLNSIGYPYL